MPVYNSDTQSFGNRIWSLCLAAYFLSCALQFVLSGGFVCGPVIILSLNVFRPHYADDDDDDDDDWAHMCVKSVSLAFPLLRRVQLPFPFGAPEAGRRLWQALSLIAAPEIHSTPNPIVSRPLICIFSY